MVFWHKKNKIIKTIIVSISFLLVTTTIIFSGINFIKVNNSKLYNKIFFDTGNISSSSQITLLNNSNNVFDPNYLIDANNNSSSPILTGKKEVVLSWEKDFIIEKVKILFTGNSTYSLVLKTQDSAKQEQFFEMSTTGSQIEIDLHNNNIKANQLLISISSSQPYQINEISVFNIEYQTLKLMFNRFVWVKLYPILSIVFIFFLPIILTVPLSLVLSSNSKLKKLFILPIIISIYYYFQNPVLAFKIIVISNIISFIFIYKKQFSSDRFALIICIQFFLYLSVLSIMKMYSFSSGWTLDFATLNNALWNASHLKSFFSSGLINISTEYQGRLSTIFGHSSFILIPIAIIYRIFPWPSTLLIIQSFSLALACFIFYLLTKDYLKDKFLSILLLLCLLFYPQLTWIGLADFRPEIFSVLFLFLTFYFIKRNSLYAFLSFIAAMFSSELNPLYGITFSIYLFAIKKKTLAFIFLISGLSYFLIFTRFISPLLSAGENTRTLSDQYGYIQTLINTFPPVNLNNITQLIIFLSDRVKIGLFLRLFNPLFRIPLYNPIFLFLGTPGIFRLIALNVHTRNFYESTLIYYASGLIPIMFFTTVLLIKNLGKKTQLLFVYLILVTTVISFYIENKSNFGIYKNISMFNLTERDKFAHEASRLIPKNAILYTSQKYLVPFSSRNKIFVFNGLNDSVINNGNYVLIDLWGRLRETNYDEEEYQKLDKEKIYSEFFEKYISINQKNNIIYNKDGILLLKNENFP